MGFCENGDKGYDGIPVKIAKESGENDLPNCLESGPFSGSAPPLNILRMIIVHGLRYEATIVLSTYTGTCLVVCSERDGPPK